MVASGTYIMGGDQEPSAPLTNRPHINLRSGIQPLNISCNWHVRSHARDSRLLRGAFSNSPLKGLTKNVRGDHLSSSDVRKTIVKIPNRPHHPIPLPLVASLPCFPRLTEENLPSNIPIIDSVLLSYQSIP